MAAAQAFPEDDLPLQPDSFRLEIHRETPGSDDAYFINTVIELENGHPVAIIKNYGFSREEVNAAKDGKVKLVKEIPLKDMTKISISPQKFKSLINIINFIGFMKLPQSIEVNSDVIWFGTTRYHIVYTQNSSRFHKTVNTPNSFDLQYENGNYMKIIFLQSFINDLLSPGRTDKGLLKDWQVKQNEN
jgi:hypothetical protein